MGPEMVNSITVLLAAYNGLPYLHDQLASLRAQTFPFRVIMQDDGSSDGTQNILRTLSSEDQRFVLGQEQGRHLGAAGNFFSLLAQTSGPVALCDQDDIWRSDKLERLASAMEAAQLKYGEHVPLLVHSDLQISDENGHVIHDSFFAHQHWNPQCCSLSQLLVQNHVTGCACLLNEPLRALVTGRSHAGTFMHDWFIAQTAAAFGHIVFVPQTLAVYRQHGDNTIGASKTGLFRRVLKAVAAPSKAVSRIRLNYQQAEILLESYKDILPPEEQNIIRAFLEIPRKPKWSRAILLRKGNYLMQTPALRLAQYIFT